MLEKQKFTRADAISIFQTMQGITLSNGVTSIAFKTNYALETNIRNWNGQIQQIQKAQRTLMDKLPEGFVNKSEDGSISITAENMDKPECDELKSFMAEEEEFEVFKFDGEGLNSEQNKWQTIVKILFPLLKEPV